MPAKVDRLSALRKQELEVIDNKAMSRRDKFEASKQIDKERQQVEIEFNREFYGTQRGFEGSKR
jgi:hypothetical protein